MIRSFALALIGLIAVLTTGHAAVLITIENRGGTETEVFDNQVFYQLENGNLVNLINLKTNTCSMFLHEHQIRIEGKCDEAKKEMEAAMSESMEKQGITREQMMAMQKMMAQNRPQTIDIKPTGAETIAKQPSDCYALGETRRMCISAAVTALIEREFSFKKMISVMRQFEGGLMGREPSAADKAEMELRRKGYVMKDVDLETGIPNIGALRALPEAVRKQMMEKFQQSGGEMAGRTVVSVETNAKFTPTIPDYPKKTMREFAQQMMSR